MSTFQREKAPWEDYGQELVGKDDAGRKRPVALSAQTRQESTSEATKEDLARRKEENDYRAREYQWVKPEEYADRGPRIGKILNSSKLITILREMGLKAWYRH